MTVQDAPAAATPKEILEAWKMSRSARDVVARRAARAIAAEAREAPRLWTLTLRMEALVRDMARAPARDDADLSAKLELWGLLMEADAAEDCDECAAAGGLVRSVAEALAARRAA